jgi:hypothetical protein
MLATAIPVAFDGRDITYQAVPDEVVGFGLLACPYCGTVRDARYPFCCEFAGERAPQPVLVAQ